MAWHVNLKNRLVENQQVYWRCLFVHLNAVSVPKTYHDESNPMDTFSGPFQPKFRHFRSFLSMDDLVWSIIFNLSDFEAS